MLSIKRICSTAVLAIYGGLQSYLLFLPCLSTSGTPQVTILILGASSAAGAATIQLLRLPYPSLQILAPSSEEFHALLSPLKATAVFNHHSPNSVSEIKTAPPHNHGVDAIIDYVGAGGSQTYICKAVDPDRAKKYAFIITGLDLEVPDRVTNALAVAGRSSISKDMHTIASLTKLVEDRRQHTLLIGGYMLRMLQYSLCL
jgi:NADPH:quinone reductase-like Zn-dependent oxidoreductase